MVDKDLAFAPAWRVNELIEGKQVSPVELTEVFYDRIEALNPKLNAYVTLTAKSARKEAKRAEEELMRKGAKLGPLHGVPFSIKDLTLTKGVPTMRGSRIYEDFVPTEDAPLVTRLRVQ